MNNFQFSLQPNKESNIKKEETARGVCEKSLKSIYNLQSMIHLHMNGKWWVSSLIARRRLRSSNRRCCCGWETSNAQESLYFAVKNSPFCAMKFLTFFAFSSPKYQFDYSHSRVWFSNKFNYCPKSYNYFLWFLARERCSFFSHPKIINFNICEIQIFLGALLILSRSSEEWNKRAHLSTLRSHIARESEETTTIERRRL